MGQSAQTIIKYTVGVEEEIVKLEK